MTIRPLSSILERRKKRIRAKFYKSGRPRLSVHRTNQHIYAQIIDDGQGKTIVAAYDATYTGTKLQRAVEVGKAIGEQAIRAGVKAVVFDRGIFAYHGRIKALAEAARQAGLIF